MENSSREKIALIVFLVLAIGAGCVLFGYIFAGHSWNIVSTNLDDTFGNMDGYTVIAYEGTLDEATSASFKDGEGDTPSSRADTSAKSLSVTDSLAQAAAGSSSQADGSDGTDGSSSTSSRDVSASAGSSRSSDGSIQTGTSDADSASSGAGQGKQGDSSSDSPAPLTGHKKEKEPVALADVEAAYTEKGASILSLDTTDSARYSEGTILKRGGKRYGIFSIDGESSRILIDEKVKYLSDQKVDYVIAIAQNASMLKGAEGIDIVITTQDEDISSMGETKSGTFYVAAPNKGSIGAILISPSNVVSAKTISEL